MRNNFKSAHEAVKASQGENSLSRQKTKKNRKTLFVSESPLLLDREECMKEVATRDGE